MTIRLLIPGTEVSSATHPDPLVPTDGTQNFTGGINVSGNVDVGTILTVGSITILNGVVDVQAGIGINGKSLISFTDTPARITITPEADNTSGSPPSSFLWTMPAHTGSTGASNPPVYFDFSNSWTFGSAFSLGSPAFFEISDAGSIEATVGVTADNFSLVQIGRTPIDNSAGTITNLWGLRVLGRTNQVDDLVMGSSSKILPYSISAEESSTVQFLTSLGVEIFSFSDDSAGVRFPFTERDFSLISNTYQHIEINKGRFVKTGSAYVGEATDIRMSPRVGGNNNQNWTATIGLSGTIVSLETLAGSTGLITGAAGHYVKAAIEGGATYDNVYGIYIEESTVGATRNDSIHVVGGRTFLGGNLDVYGTTVVTGLLTVSGSAGSALVNLTDTPTINTDAATGNTFHVTVTGTHTLANPTNMNDGFTYVWEVEQDPTGGRTLSYDTEFKFPGGAAPVLTTTASGIDVLSCIKTTNGLLCNMTKDYS